MKKALILLMSLIMVVGLVACGGETEDKEVGSVESDGKSSKTGDEGKNKEVGYDEVLLDSDSAKVTLKSISHIKNKDWNEEYYSIKFSIENKLDKTIVVQSDQVSADGMMVTDDVTFSEEVAGGKKANGELRIETYDADLPPLDESLEFLLLIIDEESYDNLDEQQVNVTIK